MVETMRLAGNKDRNEGLRVVTSTGGDTYAYDLREVDGADDTLRLVERRKNGNPTDPKLTDTVEETAEEWGYDVAEVDA